MQTWQQGMNHLWGECEWERERWWSQGEATASVCMCLQSAGFVLIMSKWEQVVYIKAMLTHHNVEHESRLRVITDSSRVIQLSNDVLPSHISHTHILLYVIYSIAACPKDWFYSEIDLSVCTCQFLLISLYCIRMFMFIRHNC